jgi:hypothetical protein
MATPTEVNLPTLPFAGNVTPNHSQPRVGRERPASATSPGACITSTEPCRETRSLELLCRFTPSLLFLALGLLVGLTVSGCGSDDTGNKTKDSSSASDPSGTGLITASGTPASSEKDACSALPRATIQHIVGADPGVGELEHAARSTLCRYYGEAQVTVEIDPGALVTNARTSIEAYGDHCETSDDIGDQALFCTGGMKAMGNTGQIVWTDGGHTYYVVYNFGEGTPSKDLPLQLARQLHL